MPLAQIPEIPDAGDLSAMGVLAMLILMGSAFLFWKGLPALGSWIQKREEEVRQMQRDFLASLDKRDQQVRESNTAFLVALGENTQAVKGLEHAVDGLSERVTSGEQRITRLEQRP